MHGDLKTMHIERVQVQVNKLTLCSFCTHVGAHDLNAFSMLTHSKIWLHGSYSWVHTRRADWMCVCV